MPKRLTPEERKKIVQLAGKGLKPYEIRREIPGRDTRTIKRYLALYPSEQIPELLRLQSILKHWNDIRHRIKQFEVELEFPPPEQLDISDLSKGGRGFSPERKPIQWQQANDGKYMVKLGDEFNWVIQHLRSSRRKTTLDNLEQWQGIGGRCIEDCHDLRLHIKKEAERRTGLVTIPNTGQRGLLDDFSWTIYRLALCDDKREGYEVVSRREGLCLLHWGMYNLAWVKDDERDRIIDIHQKLIRYYQKLSTTKDILKGKQHLEQLRKTLCEKLNKFADLPIIPGKCDGCPS